MLIDYRGQKLRGVPVVRLDDSPELLSATDCSFHLHLEVIVEHFVVYSDASMGTLGVVIPDPGLRDVIELSAAETKKEVEAFSFQRFDEGLDECVGLRRPRRNLDTSSSKLFPKDVEFIRVLSVPVPNQVPGFDSFVFHPHGGVSSLLHYPGAIGIIGRRAAIDPTATQMNENQYISVHLATNRGNPFRKKVTTDDGVDVRVNKRRPGDRRSTAALVGRGVVPGLAEDTANGRRTNPDAQFLQLTYNSTVSPEKILFRESENKLAGGVGYSWPSRRAIPASSSNGSHPSPVRFELDDVQDFRDIVFEVSAESQEFRSFGRRRHYATRIDARSQHPNLRLEKSHASIVPGVQALHGQGHDGIELTFHVDSFRSRVSTKHPENKAYRGNLHFGTPRTKLSFKEGRKSLRRSVVERERCTVNCTVRSEEHVAHVLHVVRSSTAARN